MSYTGTVKNGVIVLPPEVKLEEGAQVEVVPRDPSVAIIVRFNFALEFRNGAGADGISESRSRDRNVDCVGRSVVWLDFLLEGVGS